MNNNSVASLQTVETDNFSLVFQNPDFSAESRARPMLVLASDSLISSYPIVSRDEALRQAILRTG